MLYGYIACRLAKRRGVSWTPRIPARSLVLLLLFATGVTASCFRFWSGGTFVSVAFGFSLVWRLRRDSVAIKERDAVGEPTD